MNANNRALPHGLRHVLAYVNFDGAFPLAPNSPRDIALLRAANLAMRRKSQGVTDIFLFLIAGEGRSGAAGTAINNYGFPGAEIVYLDCKHEQEELLPDYDTFQEETDHFIEKWLNKQHSGAISFSKGCYDVAQFWWTGIEHDDNVFDWPFEASDFASELPGTHRKKAETWLTLLGHANGLHATQASVRIAQGQQRAAVLAATLCEWLHGFEAACGNGYNLFDGGSAIRTLGISDFFLGFEASRLSSNELEDFCDKHEEDVDGLGAAALALITTDFRYELRNALASFFGGDAPLFWALHSAIWPKFDQPMMNLFDALLGSQFIEDLAELEVPWMFVTDGWSETAYA